MIFNNNTLNLFLTLDKVDLEKVIFWGFKRQLINENFVIKFAESYIASGNKDIVWLTLAALLKNETSNVIKIFSDHIDSHEVVLQDGQLYNNIWFYLSIASNLAQEGYLQ